MRPARAGFYAPCAATLYGFLTRKELFNNTKDRQKRIKTVNSIIGAVAGVTVWSIAILMVLDKFGVPIAPTIASAGIVGAAIAFWYTKPH